jgi:hypothetical protein
MNTSPQMIIALMRQLTGMDCHGHHGLHTLATWCTSTRDPRRNSWAQYGSRRCLTAFRYRLRACRSLSCRPDGTSPDYVPAADGSTWSTSPWRAHRHGRHAVRQEPLRLAPSAGPYNRATTACTATRLS